MITIEKITDLLGFARDESVFCKEGYGYRGVFLTGDFEGIYDYGRGVVEITVHNSLIKGVPFLTISTIDDGQWQAFTRNEIDLDRFVEDFTERFPYKLGTEEEVNTFLSGYKLYGTNTG